MARHDIIRWTSLRSTDPDSPWNFILSHPTSAETYFQENRTVEMTTKMCLARNLQMRDHLTDAKRDALWNDFTKVELLAEVAGEDFDEDDDG